MAGGRKNKGKAHASSSADRGMPPPTNVPMRGGPSTPTDHSLSPAQETLPGSPVVPESSHSNASGIGDARIRIEVRGNEFTNESRCARAIGDIITSNFSGEPGNCWYKWKRIPLNYRRMMFGEFSKKFYWMDNETRLVWAVFEHRCSEILKTRLCRARTPRKQPNWIGDAHWQELCNHWDTEDYKKLCQINKQNRQSDCGGEGYPNHKGGSKSHLSHYDDMAHENGGNGPKMGDFYLKLHSTLDENGQPKFTDRRSETTYNKWQEEVSQNPELETQSDDAIANFQTWADKLGGVNSKGRVIGLGGAASLISKPTSSSKSWTSKWESPAEAELKKELEQMKEQNKSLADRFSKMEEIVMRMPQFPQWPPQTNPAWPPQGNPPYPPPGNPAYPPPGNPAWSAWPPQGNQASYPPGYPYMPPPFMPDTGTGNMPSSSSQFHGSQDRDRNDDDNENDVDSDN